jgi:hypothetical protein
MKAIQKSGEPLITQQEKNMNTIKLLLRVVTARLEAPVLLGNKFLYACVKEECHLRAHPHADTFQ